MMEKELKTLQLFYASLMADSVYHYHRSGILNMVTGEKRKRQAFTAESQLKQLGISNPEELFKFFSKVFGCIHWDFMENKNNKKEAMAIGNHCILCSLAKKMQTAQPCYIYCINPFSEMLNAMNPPYHLSVDETLWEGKRCVFRVSEINREINNE